MHAVLQSAIAGCVATLPMTVWMLGAQQLLPEREQYPLPPENITANAAEKVGLDVVADDEHARQAVSTFNHFAYGAVVGAAYTPLRNLPGPPVLKGVAFGLCVWLFSYLKLLPALHLLSSAKHHPMRRNWLMIIAHFIWGGTLAVMTERARR